MIPFLAPLKESIWIRVSLLSFFSGIFGVGLWGIMTNYGSMPMLVAGLITSMMMLIIAVGTGYIVSAYTLKSTDFLAKAILLVTHQDHLIEAPDPNTLGPAKEFLASLATSVYNLTSAQAQKDTSGTDLPFYRTLANTMPLPIIVVNKEQQISFVNESAVRYLELPASDIINKPLYDAMNLSFVSSMTLESWIAGRAQNSVATSEVWERVRLTLANDTHKQFDLAAHYSNNDPNGLETILVIFDRTRIYERDDHDLTFVSLAVHELRTPLTIMRGYIEVFEDELSDNLSIEQTSFMHNMGASAQQLTSFVANILNVARVEENALILHLKQENWKEVLLTACKDMELRAHVHNKELIYDIADNLPPIAVDKVSIYEVTANLIDNAIKYTHTDEQILIRSYEKDGMIETTVTDKGVGISEGLIGHVFDKFYRAHQSKNSVGGTGLGLYLSHAIVNAHGGTIWVQSKEGEGSTFGFSLPIYANVADQIKDDDNGQIIRGAHGWIKNHSLYRE